MYRQGIQEFPYFLGLRSLADIAPPDDWFCVLNIKGAVLQLTRAPSLEWARHHIPVNALSPGYIETELNSDFFATEPGQALIRRIPQRRLGQPADLDGALMLLLSDLGGLITGADIAVDGGHLVSSR